MVKNPPASIGASGDIGSIPGPGRSPRVGNGNWLQYSCLENPIDIGFWRATVHGLQRLKHKKATECARTHTHAHTHTHNVVLQIQLYSNYTWPYTFDSVVI